MRGQIVCLVVLMMACGEAQPPPPVPEPARVPEAPVAPVAEPDPVYDDPGRVEPFDFWRVLLDPELRNTEQLCVAARVSEVADPDRRHMPRSGSGRPVG